MGICWNQTLLPSGSLWLFNHLALLLPWVIHCPPTEIRLVSYLHSALQAVICQSAPFTYKHIGRRPRWRMFCNCWIPNQEGRLVGIKLIRKISFFYLGDLFWLLFYKSNHLPCCHFSMLFEGPPFFEGSSWACLELSCICEPWHSQKTWVFLP